MSYPAAIIYMLQDWTPSSVIRFLYRQYVYLESFLYILGMEFCLVKLLPPPIAWFAILTHVVSVVLVLLREHIHGSSSTSGLSELSQSSDITPIEALDHDCIQQIVERVRNSVDFLACRGVCRLWRRASNYSVHWDRGTPPPCLMLSRKPHHGSGRDTRRCFSPFTGRAFELKLSTAARRSIFISGSPHGCLLTVDPELRVHLLNPVSKSDGAGNVAAAELPRDVVTMIAKCLSDVKDEVSMAETCVLWRGASKPSDWESRAPPLLISDGPENPETDSRRCFSLWNRKVFELKLVAARKRRCWGSPHGWLATVGTDLGIQLLNPISEARINLPPLPTIPTWPSPKIPGLIHKICILKISTPRAVKFLVTVILFPGELLAYYWVNADGVDGLEEWILVNNPQKLVFCDVAYIRGKNQVYALSGNHSLVRINFSRTVSANDQVELVAHLPTEEFVGNHLQNEKKSRVYLVDSDDVVFVVYRYSDDIELDHKTLEFVLYRLNSDELGWEAVDSIEDKAFFVGNGNSWSISQASAMNCENNSIYFVDDNPDHDWALIGASDIGVYNIETRLTDSINFGVVDTYLGLRSTWITPGLIPIPTVDT